MYGYADCHDLCIMLTVIMLSVVDPTTGLAQDIRLVWKGLQGTTDLAYI
jgi:hypothetical protein